MENNPEALSFPDWLAQQIWDGSKEKFRALQEQWSDLQVDWLKAKQSKK